MLAAHPSVPAGVAPPDGEQQKDSRWLFLLRLLQAGSVLSNIAHLEMDLQPDVLEREGDPRQELPFTPVHAPAPPFVPR